MTRVLRQSNTTSEISPGMGCLSSAQKLKLFKLEIGSITILFIIPIFKIQGHMFENYTMVSNMHGLDFMCKYFVKLEAEWSMWELQFGFFE